MAIIGIIAKVLGIILLITVNIVVIRYVICEQFIPPYWENDKFTSICFGIIAICFVLLLDAGIIWIANSL